MPKLDRKSLGLLLSIIFFTINYVLNTIKSLMFMRNIFPVSMQMVNLLNGLIISLAIGYSVAFLFGQKENNNEKSFPIHGKALNISDSVKNTMSMLYPYPLV